MSTDRSEEDETALEEQSKEPAAATQQTVVDRRGLTGWARVAEMAKALQVTKQGALRHRRGRHRQPLRDP